MATFRLLLILATALFVAFNMSAARAADASSPLVMVASPGLVGSYAKTVLIALPAGNGTHLGFILNRPTQTKLAALLPGYPPAKQVAAPIFIGGPETAVRARALEPDVDLVLDSGADTLWSRLMARLRSVRT